MKTGVNDIVIITAVIVFLAMLPKISLFVITALLLLDYFWKL